MKKNIKESYEKKIINNLNRDFCRLLDFCVTSHLERKLVKNYRSKYRSNRKISIQILSIEIMEQQYKNHSFKIINFLSIKVNFFNFAVICCHDSLELMKYYEFL